MAKAQSALNIQYAQVSEKASLARYYLNQNNAACAKKQITEARELTATYRIQSFNEHLQHLELDLHFLLKDTAACIRIYRKMPVAEIRWQIPSLSQKSDKFHFVYAADKSYYDSIYLSYVYDLNLQTKEKQIHDKLTRILGEDQFMRPHSDVAYFLWDLKTSENRSLLPLIDSIHSIQLTQLLLADSQCHLATSEMAAVYTLSVHLTRYDTTTFLVIKNYFDKCFGAYNRFSALLEENRHYSKNRTYTFYEYIPPQFTNDLPYGDIDKLRLENGLPSLFYNIINSNTKMPAYYKKQFEALTNCD